MFSGEILVRWTFSFTHLVRTKFFFVVSRVSVSALLQGRVLLLLDVIIFVCALMRNFGSCIFWRTFGMHNFWNQREIMNIHMMKLGVYRFTSCSHYVLTLCSCHCVYGSNILGYIIFWLKAQTVVYILAVLLFENTHVLQLSRCFWHVYCRWSLFWALSVCSLLWVRVPDYNMSTSDVCHYVSVMPIFSTGFNVCKVSLSSTACLGLLSAPYFRFPSILYVSV